jgi:hypothetical protein
MGGGLGGGVGGGAEVAGCRGRKGGITVTAGGGGLPGKEGRHSWGSRVAFGSWEGRRAWGDRRGHGVWWTPSLCP